MKDQMISLRLSRRDKDAVRAITAYMIRNRIGASPSRSEAIRKAINMAAECVRAGDFT